MPLFSCDTAGVFSVREMNTEELMALSRVARFQLKREKQSLYEKQCRHGAHAFLVYRHSLHNLPSLLPIFAIYLTVEMTQYIRDALSALY